VTGLTPALSQKKPFRPTVLSPLEGIENGLPTDIAPGKGWVMKNIRTSLKQSQGIRFFGMPSQPVLRDCRCTVQRRPEEVERFEIGYNSNLGSLYVMPAKPGMSDGVSDLVPAAWFQNGSRVDIYPIGGKYV
jgi:hypothetical protein